MDPLDLFSDNSRGVRLDATSSPVTKEQEYALLKQELLGTKAALAAEIDELELEMNQLVNKEKEESESLRKQEEDLVMKLLLDAESEEKPTREVEEENEEEDELDQYSAQPLKQWDIRFEYLQKFYPATKIGNIISTISLEYIDDVKSMIKNLSFDLNIGNLIKFKIELRLNKFKETYQVYDLDLIKESNNKLNSILINISEYYNANKNINEFLLTLNNLYDLFKKRLELFSKFNENKTLLNNSVSFKRLTIYCDFVFNDGELDIIYSTNMNEIDEILDLFIENYGIEIGLGKFLERIDNYIE